MQALLLVGGRGTRLKPYTTVIPKPLLPIGSKPILEILLSQLKKAGITEIILAVGYLPHLFTAFFGDGKDFGLNIKYSYEDEPLGTAGAIANCIDEMADNFLVLNGDLLTTLDFQRLINFHLQNKAGGTIATYKREVKIDFGVTDFDSSGKLLSYNEKPSFFYNFGMGINVLNKHAISPLLKEGIYLDMPDLMLQIMNSGREVFCYQEECFWLDMGRPDDYEEAIRIFEQDSSKFI